MKKLDVIMLLSLSLILFVFDTFAQSNQQKQFFSDKSFWNQPIPENSEIDPKSSEKVTREEIDKMPLIEVHCDIDYAWHQLPKLQETENVNYTLWIARDHKRLIEFVKSNNNKGGGVLWINPKNSDYKKIEKLTKK